ncbi:replication-relaxation family protein [Solibacillus cecembensis]|uniref:replication-relaxation family protein n=1 Tax=Solibacillus cecembensis TaxID=459347 RepID=UPI003D01958E
MKKQLSSREEKILLLLQKFDFLTRDQLNQYFHLGTIGNANKVLYKLTDYLSTIRDGYETIYYLNSLGREYVGCDKVRRKGGQVKHTIMRNEFWLFYKSPVDWKNEIKISDGTTNIIVDGIFTRNGFQHYLEVDNFQTMKQNREKIKRYRTLMDSIVKQMGYYPTIVWLTTTELRRNQLEKACEGLKCKVYTLEDIK